jgi:hypothetical protein
MLQSEGNKSASYLREQIFCNFVFGTEHDVNLIKVQIYDKDSSQQKYYAK